MGFTSSLSLFILLLLLLLPLFRAINGESIDAEALLTLKSEVDPWNSLRWERQSRSSLCTDWSGVKECNANGRVMKLVLELLNLTGPLKSETLAPLDQLRVLSFKSNSLSGPLPDLSPLLNLKSVYLNDNRFTGKIPASLSSLHRLKIVVLSDNLLTGEIPASFAQIPRLYTLLLQNNRLTGRIPTFNQQSLELFNVSNNKLSGEIPNTKPLSQFNISSFLNISDLCGAQIQNPCPKNPTFPPSPSPPSSSSSAFQFSPQKPAFHHKNKNKLLRILVASISSFLLLAIFSVLLALLCCKRKQSSRRRSGVSRDLPNDEAAASRGGNREAKREFSWENEGLGKLNFVGGIAEMYSLEDLLKASAETLGRGTVGSTYKAVMGSGFIVTVKRLKDSGTPLGVEEFRRKMEELGRLRHPNLVPLRAYFQAKEERLLIYDYFPNGSLFSLIHGNRPSGSGKPLHWTSCLKIAEDVATGLLYLHESNTMHGNLKSSNVLLGPDFESCLSDYALLPLSKDANSPSTLTPQSDIYNLGLLLLELLTGKTPNLVNDQRAHISRWVRSVREQETEYSGGDETSEEKLRVLLNIALACVAGDVEKRRRPVAKEVVRMIKESRAEVAVVSSNSSELSPGRWSDTVQSLPREYGSEHSGFAERD